MEAWTLVAGGKHADVLGVRAVPSSQFSGDVEATARRLLKGHRKRPLIAWWIVALLLHCREEKSSPTLSLIELTRKHLRVPKAPRFGGVAGLSKDHARAFLAAVRFEAKHPPDPDGKRPSTASEYAVAKNAKVARIQIHRFIRSKSLAYKEYVEFFRGTRLRKQRSPR